MMSGSREGSFEEEVKMNETLDVTKTFQSILQLFLSRDPEEAKKTFLSLASHERTQFIEYAENVKLNSKRSQKLEMAIAYAKEILLEEEIMELLNPRAKPITPNHAKLNEETFEFRETNDIHYIPNNKRSHCSIF